MLSHISNKKIKVEVNGSVIEMTREQFDDFIKNKNTSNKPKQAKTKENVEIKKETEAQEVQETEVKDAEVKEVKTKATKATKK